MTILIFAGDMLVMAFMIGLAVWVINRDNDTNIDAVARIPLQDELESDLAITEIASSEAQRGSTT
jgi:hypothetical protein